MTEKPYFDRLKDVLDGLEACVLDDENYWGYRVEILDLWFEALVRNISFEPEQLSFVRDQALEHLKMGDKGEFHALCAILAYTGYGEFESVNTSLTHHFFFKEGRPKPSEIAIRLLTEAGVFENDEKLRYFDVGWVGFQKKDVGRSGLIILTDRRIVVVGTYSNLALSSKQHRPFYGEMKEPYLSTVDFLYLDRLKDIKLKKKEIQMKYDTEYIVEKERTFYGPYFFKFDLPTSVSVKSGTIKVIVTPTELGKKTPTRSDEDSFMVQAFKKWDGVEVPKDYDRSRLQKFYNLIQSVDS